MSSSTFSPSLPALDALVIRPAYPDDTPTLARLAALDSQRPLAGSTIADPFAPTADLVALLRLHAAETARGFAGRRDFLRRVGASTRWLPAHARG